MQFLVVAHDGKDEQAMQRRLAAREAHLKAFEAFYNSGRFLYGAAILNDDGRMIGSMIVCDFESEQELKEKWLEKEPYVTGNVWQHIDISRAQIPPILSQRH